MQDSLWTAAERGDVAGVRALLAEGAPLEARNPAGLPALLIAAKQGHVDVLEALLAAGANIDGTSRAGSTALIFAAYAGHQEAVEMLLANGADVHTRGEKGRTALMYAAAHGHTGVARLLIQQGADAGPALVEAAKQQRETMLRCLLDCGADVNATDARGWTPIFYAALNGVPSLVEMLIAAGADVNHRNRAGRTAISYIGSVPILRLLVTRGAETDFRYPGGQTLLMWAIEKKVTELVALLLEYGADVDATDRDGNTALYYAELHRCKQMAEWLRNRGGVDPIPPETRQENANLFRATQEGDEKGVQAALDHGAQIDARDLRHHFGFTALAYAADQGHIEVVQLLLDRRARVSATDSYLDTPLKWAAWNGHTAVVRLLLERGAKGIEEAVHAAAFQGQAETVEFLLDRGARVDDRHREDSETLLLTAAGQGHLEVVRLLLDRGADLHSRHHGGVTPLIMGAMRAHTEVVRLLLERGAGRIPKELNRAVSSAVYYGSAELLTLLLASGADLRGKKGRSAALDAASTCNTPVLRLLFERGVTLSQADVKQALMRADTQDRDVGKLDPDGTRALLLEYAGK